MLTAQGELPRLPAGWRAERRDQVGRGRLVLGRLRGRRRPGATSCSRSRWSMSRARESMPEPGPCCCPVPSAGCSGWCRSRSSCRPRTSTCAARTGTTTSPPWCTSRSTCAPATSKYGPLGIRRRSSSTRGPGAGRRATPTGRCSAWWRRPSSQVNKGQLKLGDALFLYSDGMVETPRRDIGLGTDRLAGHAERLVAHGFKGAAHELVARDRRPGRRLRHRRHPPPDEPVRPGRSRPSRAPPRTLSSTAAPCRPSRR